MKLADYKCTRTSCRRLIEQTRERVLISCLSPLFNEKQSMKPVYFLRWIKNSGSKSRKYSCELTPTKIHKVRYKTKHNQRIFSKSWRLDNANWVRQFINWIQNETSGSRVHNISLEIIYRTNKITGLVACLLTLFQCIFFGSKIDFGCNKLNM